MDWKAILAAGIATGIVICALKMSGSDAAEVAERVADACGNIAIPEKNQ